MEGLFCHICKCKYFIQSKGCGWLVDVHGRVIVWVWPAMSRYSRGILDSFKEKKIVLAAVAVVVGLITDVDQVPNNLFYY